MKTFCGVLITLLICRNINSAQIDSGCDHTINTTSGSVPDPGPGDVCTYTFQQPKPTPFYFTIKALNLRLGDAVEFYNGSSNDTLVASFHGNVSDVEHNNKIVYVLAENMMTLVYRKGSNTSDATKDSTQFKIDYDTTCNVKVKASQLMLLQAPIYVPTSGKLHCTYTVTNDLHPDKIAIGFQNVTITKGSIAISNVTYNDGTTYIPDVITAKDVVINMTLATSQESYWTAAYESVSEKCSGMHSVDDRLVVPIPMDEHGDYLNNMKCRWVIKNDDKKAYRVRYIDLGFGDTGDTLTVIDGDSKFSRPIGIFTQGDNPEGQIITSGPEMTLTFYTNEAKVAMGMIIIIETLTAGGRFTSETAVNITGSPQRYNRSEIYLLFDGAVDDPNNKVMLQITAGQMFPSTTITCFDGSSIESDRRIADFTTDTPFYEIASSGGELLCRVKNMAYNNSESLQFKSKFFSDNSMTNSFDLDGSFRLESDDLMSDVTWLIYPKTKTDILRLWTSELVVLPTCHVTVGQGLQDMNEKLAVTNSSQFMFPVIFTNRPGVGLRVTYKCQSFTKTSPNQILYQGYYANIPSCHTVIKGTSSGDIVAPLYPDHYPFNANCSWMVDVPQNKSLHIYYEKVEMVHNAKASVSWSGHNMSSEEVVSSEQLPPDVVKQDGHVEVRFSSVAFNKPMTSFQVGYFAAKYQFLDCGAQLNTSSGTLKTPGYPAAPNMSTTCVWVVRLPEKQTESAETSIVSYVINIQGMSENSSSKVEIYDGDVSMNSSKVALDFKDGATSAILSRYSQLLIKYQFEPASNTSKSFAFQLEFNTHACSKLCDNGICKHDDWVCNGVDDCGDGSDERNCLTVKTKRLGGIIALVVILALIVGVLLAVFVPKIYRKIRYRNYSQFSNPTSITA